MKFTQIPDKLPYPPSVRARLSTIHSNMITLSIGSYTGSFKDRQRIIQSMNSISYIIIRGDSLPSGWSGDDPFKNLKLIDDDICRQVLGNMYIMEKKITWDIDPVYSASTVKHEEPISKPEEPVEEVREVEYNGVPTPKEDLYIMPPVVPRFNTKKVYASGSLAGTTYAVYFSEPDIPTKQNEISATTDVSKMRPSDLRNLFPNHFIRTRPSCMYSETEGLSFHPDLGIILPIEGFTEEQVLDNIVKYPHIFRLNKIVDGKISSFYTTLEIDGQLYNVSDVWNDVVKDSPIPYMSDFVKEYVVRRYLLERDVKKIDHKYPLFGSLDPFLTLFTTPHDYIKYGYLDIEGIAKQCVTSRVSYKLSRNPVIRRLQDV